MTKRHAEIVGAGFAGLTAACALARRGWSVRVHERADRLRTTGAGIYIYENGLRVLEAVGAYEAAVKGAPFAHTREVRDDQNRTISTHKWQGSRVFSIVRQTVINALAESATRPARRSSRTRRRLRRAAQAKSRCPTAGAQGRSGHWRRRLELQGPRRPWPSGTAQAAGGRLHAAAHSQEPEEERGQDGATTVEYWSGSRRVLYTPCSPTEVYIALTMLNSDDAAKAVPVDKAAWKRWFPHLDALIERLGDEGRYDRFEYIRLKRWAAGKAAVIGDAAHALPPNIGQGGGCAMMNALSMAVYLNRENDVPKALDMWERQRAPAHRAHPAHLADARLADHLAAAHPRQGAWRWRASRNGWCASAPKTALHMPTGT